VREASRICRHSVDLLADVDPSDLCLQSGLDGLQQ